MEIIRHHKEAYPREPDSGYVRKGSTEHTGNSCAARIVRIDRTTNLVAIIGRYSRREDAIADQRWFAVNETTGLYLIGE